MWVASCGLQVANPVSGLRCRGSAGTRGTLWRKKGTSYNSLIHIIWVCNPVQNTGFDCKHLLNYLTNRSHAGRRFLKETERGYNRRVQGGEGKFLTFARSPLSVFSCFFI